MQVSWFGFSLLCMLLSSGKSILAKKLLNSFDSLAFTFLDQLIILLILSPALQIKTISTIDSNFVILALCTIGPSLLSVVSLSRATKEGEISEVAPLLVFLPVFVALSGPLFNDQLLGKEVWYGVAAVGVGSYFLKLKDLSRPWEPLTSLFRGTGARLMWLTVGMGVCASHLQALLVEGYDAYTALFFISLGIALCLAPKVLKYHSQRQALRQTIGSNFGLVLLLGLISSSSALSQFLAYQAGGDVAAVLSIKRVSIFFIGLYGIAVLRESAHAGKIIGLVMMALGGVWLYS